MTIKCYSLLPSAFKFILFSIFLASVHACAQETEDAILYRQGTRYIDAHIHALDKYNNRIQNQQQRLLAKLSRQENRLAAKLKKTDSVGYASFMRQQPSFDSIGKLAHPDSAILAGHTSLRGNKTVDSLKAVQQFVQSKTNALPFGSTVKGTEQLNAYSGPLNQLNDKLNYNDYINSLISQRSGQLKRLSLKDNMAALTGMDKQIAYAKNKMQVWKQVASEPSAAEEKALEYLQGTEGFDKALSKASAGNGISMSGAKSAEDLERLGFQTKRQVNGLLKQQFGDNLSNLQQQMGSQVADWQKKTTDITGKAQDLKNNIADAKQTGQSLKQQMKPAFRKGNKVKGIPFWKRFEKQYSFQTSRATGDGTPALMQLSAGVGYKQTEKLVTGVGLAANIGLGQSWSNIRFSLEGIGIRTFATYEMFYGISAYAGYERIFKKLSLNTNNNELVAEPSPHNTGNYSEAVLLGLSKSYKINSKHNGAFQVLYDIWWKEKGMRSPVIIRIKFN